MKEQIILRRWRKTGRLSIDVMSAGKLFQRAGLATGNALAPTVERRTGGTRRWLDDEERRDDRHSFLLRILIRWVNLAVHARWHDVLLIFNFLKLLELFILAATSLLMVTCWRLYWQNWPTASEHCEYKLTQTALYCVFWANVRGNQFTGFSFSRSPNNVHWVTGPWQRWRRNSVAVVWKPRYKFWIVFL